MKNVLKSRKVCLLLRPSGVKLCNLYLRGKAEEATSVSYQSFYSVWIRLEVKFSRLPMKTNQ